MSAVSCAPPVLPTRYARVQPTRPPSGKPTVFPRATHGSPFPFWFLVRLVAKFQQVDTDLPTLSKRF